MPMFQWKILLEQLLYVSINLFLLDWQTSSRPLNNPNATWQFLTLAFGTQLAKTLRTITILTRYVSGEDPTLFGFDFLSPNTKLGLN